MKSILLILIVEMSLIFNVVVFAEETEEHATVPAKICMGFSESMEGLIEELFFDVRDVNNCARWDPSESSDLPYTADQALKECKNNFGIRYPGCKLVGPISMSFAPLVTENAVSGNSEIGPYCWILSGILISGDRTSTFKAKFAVLTNGLVATSQVANKK